MEFKQNTKGGTQSKSEKVEWRGWRREEERRNSVKYSLKREDGTDWGQMDADNLLRQYPKENQLKMEGQKMSIIAVKLVQSNRNRMPEINWTK